MRHNAKPTASFQTNSFLQRFGHFSTTRPVGDEQESSTQVPGRRDGAKVGEQGLKRRPPMELQHDRRHPSALPWAERHSGHCEAPIFTVDPA